MELCQKKSASGGRRSNSGAQPFWDCSTLTDNEECPSMNIAHNIAAGLDRILTMEVVRVTER
ncbi:MAG: hypothetical protein E5V53_12005, partial [Mesorhizobium sp.]